MKLMDTKFCKHEAVCYHSFMESYVRFVELFFSKENGNDSTNIVDVVWLYSVDYVFDDEALIRDLTSLTY